MTTDVFRRVLTSLDYRRSEGLVVAGDPAPEDPAIRNEWRTLSGDVQAAYFADGLPAICFLDAVESDDADAAVAAAQLRLWNRHSSRVLVAVTRDRVRFVSCLRPGVDTQSTIEETPLAPSERDGVPAPLPAALRYSAVRAGSLSQLPILNNRDPVDTSLLTRLQALRRELVTSGLAEQDANNLIGRSIFVSFLEARHPRSFTAGLKATKLSWPAAIPASCTTSLPVCGNNSTVTFFPSRPPSSRRSANGT